MSYSGAPCCGWSTKVWEKSCKNISFLEFISSFPDFTERCYWTMLVTLNEGWDQTMQHVCRQGSLRSRFFPGNPTSGNTLIHIRGNFSLRSVGIWWSYIVYTGIPLVAIIHCLTSVLYPYPVSKADLIIKAMFSKYCLHRFVSQGQLLVLTITRCWCWSLLRGGVEKLW